MTKNHKESTQSVNFKKNKKTRSSAVDVIVDRTAV